MVEETVVDEAEERGAHLYAGTLLLLNQAQRQQRHEDLHFDIVDAAGGSAPPASSSCYYATRSNSYYM